MRLVELGIQDSDSAEQLKGELTTDPLYRCCRDDPVEQALCVRSVEFLGIPPANSSFRAACSRQTTLVRCLPISTLRLASSRKILAWSAGATERKPGARRAATATERASLRSFLFEEPDPSTRTRGQGGQHVQDILAGRHELLSQEIAEATGRLDGSGPLLDDSAHDNSWSTWLRVARTCPRLSSSSPWSMATAVCVALCGSHTDGHIHCLSFVHGVGVRGGHSCFRIVLCSYLFRATPRQGPTGTPFDRQPTG